MSTDWTLGGGASLGVFLGAPSRPRSAPGGGCDLAAATHEDRSRPASCDPRGPLKAPGLRPPSPRLGTPRFESAAVNRKKGGGGGARGARGAGRACARAGGGGGGGGGMGGGVDELASDPLVDTDGCAEQLFLYLWTKNRAGGSCPGVRLPDTVGTPSLRRTPAHSLYTPRVGPACSSRF